MTSEDQSPSNAAQADDAQSAGASDQDNQSAAEAALEKKDDQVRAAADLVRAHAEVAYHAAQAKIADARAKAGEKSKEALALDDAEKARQAIQRKLTRGEGRVKDTGEQLSASKTLAELAAAAAQEANGAMKAAQDTVTKEEATHAAAQKLVDEAQAALEKAEEDVAKKSAAKDAADAQAALNQPMVDAQIALEVAKAESTWADAQAVYEKTMSHLAQAIACWQATDA